MESDDATGARDGPGRAGKRMSGKCTLTIEKGLLMLLE